MTEENKQRADDRDSANTTDDGDRLTTTACSVGDDVSTVDQRVTRSQPQPPIPADECILAFPSPHLSSSTAYSPYIEDFYPLPIEQATPDEQTTLGLEDNGHRCNNYPFLQSNKPVAEDETSDTSSLSSIDEALLEELLPLPECGEEVDSALGGDKDWSGSEYEDEHGGMSIEPNNQPQDQNRSELQDCTAATWIEGHMLEEPVCESCLAGKCFVGAEALSIVEMTYYFRRSGLPNALAVTPSSISIEGLWRKVLTGGDSPPSVEVRKSHAVDADLSMRFDIDAFIAEAASFEAVRGFRFSYHPKPIQNLHKPIHIWFHGRRLHQCRHIRFGEALHGQSFWIYVAFPRMPWTRETYLTHEQHALWIDEIVLPSLRQMLPSTSMQHFPPSWAHGASKMRAKHNEHRTRDVGGTSPIHYPVPEQYMPGLWQRMLQTLRKSSLAEFRGMFIVIQVYGTKLVWHDDNFSRLRDDFKRSLDTVINVDHLVLDNTFVDVGKETVSSYYSRVHWWKKCCLQQWAASMRDGNHVRTRSFPVAGLRDVGAMTLAPSKRHYMNSQGLVYAQRYGSYKEAFDAQKVFPFTNKNIESLLIPANLLQLWSRAGGTLGRSKHIDDLVLGAGQKSYVNSKSRLNLSLDTCTDEKFGSREEYRVSWALFHKLDLDSKRCRHTEPRPYLSIPTADAFAFIRWELNRWLGAFDYIRQAFPQPTPETGAMGTMLARIIKASCNDGQYGLLQDLYGDTWTTKTGVQWRGLDLKNIVQKRGMFWLQFSMFDWKTLQFKSEIQSEFRFFIPDSKNTYKERRSEVNNITNLYNGINNIVKFLGRGRRREHQLERIRRICFLALTMQVLQFDVKNQPMQPPKDLESYNNGICYSWLEQYNSSEFYVPKAWRVCATWKQFPTWAELIQQLFDWDDHDRYKVPFQRDRWDSMQFRVITRHACMKIRESFGAQVASEWKEGLGTHAARFFWMIPKCTGNRFASMTKRTHTINGMKRRTNHMAWYSGVHSQLDDTVHSECPTNWDWKNQKLWNWEDGGIMKNQPIKLFTDLVVFDFVE